MKWVEILSLNQIFPIKDPELWSEFNSGSFFPLVAWQFSTPNSDFVVEAPHSGGKIVYTFYQLISTQKEKLHTQMCSLGAYFLVVCFFSSYTN